MQHIIIVGDSWGEPNWRGPQLPGFTEQGHTAHRLARAGYTVYNYSDSGRGNLNSWQRLDSNPPPAADWIIWFHTEVIRDITSTQRGLLRQLLDQTADETYARINRIRLKREQTAGAQLIVIEGQSQRHQPQFDCYFKNYELIPDLRATLLNQKSLPYTPLLAHISNGGQILEQFTDSNQDKLLWIEQTKTIMDLMAASALFPDRCHPGDLAHAQLTRRLTDLFAAKRTAI